MFTREWGTGEKYALLIHGLASSSLAWHQLGRDLAHLGYHVIAPDLSGHGKSLHSSTYSLEEWANEIVSLGITPELLIGHSMGGLIAAKVSLQLHPAKIILLDPVVRLPTARLILRGVQESFRYSMLRRLRWKISDRTWSRRDAHIEHASIRSWDHKSSRALKSHTVIVRDCLYSGKQVLIVRAKGSYIVPSNLQRLVCKGNTTFSYLNVGHNLHCESYKELFSLIVNYISPRELNALDY